MKLSVTRAVRAFVLSSLVLLIALASVSSVSLGQAQEGGVKPIRLVSGDVIPDVVKPGDVEVSPDAVFDGRYFRLIQFAQIPDDAERKAWEAAGLYLVDYLPDDTYFAVIDRGFDLGRLSDQALTIVPVADVFRFETRLASLLARGESTGKLVVSYYATLDAQKVISDLQSRGVTIKAHRDYSRQLDIVIDPGHLSEILALPFLQFLGPEPEEPVLEGYDHRNSSGRSNYLNTGYNGLSYNGAGVVVGIGEEGTVDNLVDVKGRLTEMTAGAPSSHKITVMKNAGGAGNLDPTNRNNGWGATFLSIDDPDYAALYTSHSLRYTNHSFGVTISGGYDQTARNHDLRIAAYPNHLVIYSSGNSGDEQGYAPYNFAGCPADPAQCWANITGQMKQNKNMLAIGALNSADVLTYFSSRGPMYDGRIIPQLVIEGIEGTSDAAPKVTGELAMLAQVYKAKNGGAEPASTLLRAILMNTADDVGNAGPDHKHGYGRPNMRRAYNAIDNAQFLTSSVSNGATNLHTLAVPANTKQVRVLLVWPDTAASVGANPAIVNNLNLLLKDPPATTSYDPWVLDRTANPVSLDLPATRQVDDRNTVEQVTVDDPAAGNWTVEVSGANVPSGPQSYYLTYEFLGDELTMAFPLKDHRFVPGTTYYLRWDSYGGSGTFSLDYQLDGGGWVSIATGVSASARVYQWTAPSPGTGIHTIKFRVQRGALTSESDVNYIGGVPQGLDLDWACADGVRLTWYPVAGATAYKVYRVGTQYMEEVTTGITFDGTSAILTGQSTVDAEYYAVSAVTGAYEGLRTMALTKMVGDVNCFNVRTTLAGSVDDADVTLNGWVNPHSSTLTAAHFEYGPTTAYGATSPDIPVSVSGHTQQNMSYSVPMLLSDRAEVLHFRLVVTKDGSPVYGEDQDIRLSPGYDFTFDGADDCLNVSEHSDLPIYRSGAGTGYCISFWIKGSTQSSGKIIYGENSSASSTPAFWLMTSGTYPAGMRILLTLDNGTSPVNSSRNIQLLDNTWHHVTWTDANGSALLYLDGNQSGSAIAYTPGAITLDRAGIGARFRTAASDFFTGKIDEVSLWDKALSAAEVRALMHQGRQGTEANLKALYRLDDGPASRAFDAVSAKEAVIVGGGSKGFSTVPMGVLGTLVQTNVATSVGAAGKRLTVTITSGSPTTNYLGIYKTGHGEWPAPAETLPPGVQQRASILWGIREYGNVTANLVIDYSSLPGLNPAEVRLLKRADAASAWTDVTGSWVHNTVLRTFTGIGVTDFSEFSIGSIAPTSVMLKRFEAWPEGNAIHVQWETSQETDNLGFNLYRSATRSGPKRQLNRTLIPTKVPPGSPFGAVYDWIDARVRPGRGYWYWLEDVDIYGTTAMHGPVRGVMP